MFSSPCADKENVLGEVFCTTPNRIPLKTVHNGNPVTAEGTPLAITKRTPKPRSTRASTPGTSSRKLAKRLKRQSVPFALSKPIAIFQDGCNKQIFGKNMGAEEGLLLKENGQELNEMIRDKVSETVDKMNERFEATLAEKQHDLDEKNNIIERLQSEMNVLKQSQNDKEEEKSISIFVEQIISQAIHEIEKENSPSANLEESDPVISPKTDCVKLGSSTETEESMKDSWTTMTPTKLISSETSPIKVELVDNETSTTPVAKAHSAASVTPVHTADATLATSPVCMKDAEMSTSPLRGTDSTTNTSPDKWQTPTRSDNKTEQNLSKPENFLTPIQEEHGAQKDVLNTIEGRRMNSAIKDSHVHTGTSMTPIELVDKHTLVSPMQTSNVSVTTSPLVAALQPEIISSLPLNRLRAELESAAISNELLRNECDELNAKVEVLESTLAEVRSVADTKCCEMQQEMEELQTKLEEALELNYEMEMKKPANVEEYDATIGKLQKELLMKEKQITFYIKRASETDNLQQDLRRMYTKYNTEHQLYMTMEEETKGITERFEAKCVQYDALERELCGVKEALKNAWETIERDEKVREEAKESQVKCCVLEEQIENFQSQQREDLEFLEQERKGLEETTFELEQQVLRRTEELEAVRQALEEETGNHEETRATVQTLYAQLSDLEDERDAVQSQAHLLMFEQEKELTAGLRVLEETREKLLTLVQTCKERFRAQEEPASEENNKEIWKDEYKPSFVYSVLAAVSGTVPESNDIKEPPSKKETAKTADSIEVIVNENQVSDAENDGSSNEFSLVNRAKAVKKLLSELESYVHGGHEHAQIAIQGQVDVIANLKKSLREAKQQNKGQISNLKLELEAAGCKISEVQRENDNKQYEIERLKLELKTIGENFEISRENMKELRDRCCSLIEKETENQVLNEKLRLVSHEVEKVKQDKTCLEKQLKESLQRLQSLVEASEEKKKGFIEESFTEILNKKLHLEREVEKIQSCFSKALKENETFAQYNARLENKANILGSNLRRAEEEIYRLDGIVDRFCTATQNSWKTMTLSQDLRDLLEELHVIIE